MQSYATTKSPN